MSEEKNNKKTKEEVGSKEKNKGNKKTITIIAIITVIVIIIAAVGTFVIISIMKLFMKIRVTEADEANGLDISEHSESAYPSFTGLD